MGRIFVNPCLELVVAVPDFVELARGFVQWNHRPKITFVLGKTEGVGVYGWRP